MQNTYHNQTAKFLATVEFPVFKTIKLGTHKSVNDLRQSLKDSGNRISDWGNNILGRTNLAESETEVTLHVATVKELTGKNWATNREINEVIRSKGYDLCPAEVGPQLRLQYPDQPNGEWIRVAMEPIAGSSGKPSHLQRGSRLCWVLASRPRRSPRQRVGRWPSLRVRFAQVA